MSLKLYTMTVCVLLALFFSCQRKASDNTQAELDETAIHVAVAGNFSAPFQEIARRFEEQAGIRLMTSYGSTGKLYAQIMNGAPFDAFLAADSRRPKLLEKHKKIVPGSRYIYAVGKLVLWSPDTSLVDLDSDVLNSDRFHRLAIANPELAPYGEAAMQVLVARGLWHDLQDKLVRGENINQAYQYVMTGNAELGFVAMSQLQGPGKTMTGSWWLVPGDLYAPIEQQAVQLTDNPAAGQLMAFLKSPEIRAYIASYGYSLP